MNRKLFLFLSLTIVATLMAAAFGLGFVAPSPETAARAVDRSAGPVARSRATPTRAEQAVHSGPALTGSATAAPLATAAQSAMAAQSATAAQSDGYRLIVDRSERRLYVVEDGQVVRSFPVAVGRPGHRTPLGTFHIRRIVWNPSWRPPDSRWARHARYRPPGSRKNPMGSVKMFFLDGGYYIHGTRDYDSLGEPESHGCVRMANGEAVGLAQEVMAHGGKPEPQSWFDDVLDHSHHSREIYLPHPVKVTIRR